VIRVFDSGTDPTTTTTTAAAATVRRRHTTVVHGVVRNRDNFSGHGDDDDDDDDGHGVHGYGVHAVVADRVLGARRSAAGAQGRRDRGGHRQTVHRQGDPEPAGAGAAEPTAATPSEVDGGTGARVTRDGAPPQASEERGARQSSAGVPAAGAHRVDGLVPVDAVQDELGQRLVLRQLQQVERGAVRQQDIRVPRRPAFGPGRCLRVRRRRARGPMSRMTTSVPASGSHVLRFTWSTV